MAIQRGRGGSIRLGHDGREVARVAGWTVREGSRQGLAARDHDEWIDPLGNRLRSVFGKGGGLAGVQFRVRSQSGLIRERPVYRITAWRLLERVNEVLMVDHAPSRNTPISGNGHVIGHGLPLISRTEPAAMALRTTGTLTRTRGHTAASFGPTEALDSLKALIGTAHGVGREFESLAEALSPAAWSREYFNHPLPPDPRPDRVPGLLPKDVGVGLGVPQEFGDPPPSGTRNRLSPSRRKSGLDPDDNPRRVRRPSDGAHLKFWEFQEVTRVVWYGSRPDGAAIGQIYLPTDWEVELDVNALGDVPWIEPGNVLDRVVVPACRGGDDSHLYLRGCLVDLLEVQVSASGVPTARIRLKVEDLAVGGNPR